MTAPPVSGMRGLRLVTVNASLVKTIQIFCLLMSEGLHLDFKTMEFCGSYSPHVFSARDSRSLMAFGLIFNFTRASSYY